MRFVLRRSALRVLLLFLVANVASSRSVRRSPLDIEFQLSVGRNQLVIGESTPVMLVLRNRDTSPVSVPDPDRTDDWPKIHVRKIGTSEQVSFGPQDLERRR